MKGSTYRRCYCRDGSGKPLGKACPQLSSRRHGVHAVRQELPARADGSRRSFSRSGYSSAKDAQDALDQVRALLAIPDADDTDGQVKLGDLLEGVSKDSRAPLPDLQETERRFHSGRALSSKLTVADWLDQWLASKKSRPTTMNGYRSHVENHLRPRIGHLRLDRLSIDHLEEMFADIADANEVIAAENAARREQVARVKAARRGPEKAAERALLAAMKPLRRPVGPSTRQGIRRTLRAALNRAITRKHLTFNPAAHVELESGKRPKPVLWSADRVTRWQETGERPCPVMVWTPAQTGVFLDAAADDRLYALWHLIAFRGLRRGEAVGQDWADVDLDKGLLTVSKEIVLNGWTAYESEPKTDSGARTIALDKATVEALGEHRARQLVEKEKLGDAWTNTGKVFVQEDGTWLHPATVSNRFEQIHQAAGLPPIRLHDLRHGAASLIHASGGDLHSIKETLGHSGIAITSDTYTTLLPELDREIAEKAAALVPRARRTVEAGQKSVAEGAL